MLQEIFSFFRQPSSAKDSGWAYAVGTGCFFAYFFIYGMHYSFGIVFSRLLEAFGEDKGTTALVGSLSFGLGHLLTPFCSLFIGRYGLHSAMFMGAFLASLSMFTSSFGTEVYHLVLTFGVIYGMATGMTLQGISEGSVLYFREKRGVLYGITGAAQFAGAAALTPLLYLLLTTQTIEGVFQILTAIMAVGCSACAVLFRPHRDEARMQKSDKALVAMKPGRSFLALIRDPKCAIFLGSMMFTGLDMSVSVTHQVEVLKEMGMPLEKASMIPVYMSIANVSGRLICGKLFDIKRINNLILYQVLMVFCVSFAISAMLVSSMTTYVACLLIYIGFQGAFLTGYPIMTAEVFGESDVCKGLSLVYCSYSIPLAVGPVVAGWLADHFQNYRHLFYVSIVSLVAANAMLIPLNFMKLNSINDVDRKEDISDNNIENKIWPGSQKLLDEEEYACKITAV